MLLAMVELFSQRVLGDQGWTGRDAWDDAQATGKIEVQAQQISMQSYATAMWGWAFQRAMERYIEKHPSLRLVVSVQPLATRRIYSAIEDWNQVPSRMGILSAELSAPPTQWDRCFDHGTGGFPHGFFDVLQGQYISGHLDEHEQDRSPEARAALRTKFMERCAPNLKPDTPMSRFLTADGKSLTLPVPGVQFVLQLTDPPSANNFFFISIMGRWRWRCTVLIFRGGAGKVRRDAARAENIKAFEAFGFPATFSRAHFRFTDGTLKPAFQDSAYRAMVGEYDDERKKAVQLWGTPGQQGKSLEEQKVFAGKSVGSGFPPLDAAASDGLPIGENEKVVALSFGSQAAVAASLGYLRFSIREAREQGGKTSIFVFCVRDADLVEQVKQVNLGKADPGNKNTSIRVFALGLQGADAIAALYQRANTLIVRPGGVTAFEIRAAGYGVQRLIAHSERDLYLSPDETNKFNPADFCGSLSAGAKADLIMNDVVLNIEDHPRTRHMFPSSLGLPLDGTDIR
eukprot:g7833.t1